jgi:hypothetical protein
MAAMSTSRVDPAIAGTTFSPYEFSWDWPTTQLIARAAGCSITDVRDQPLLLPQADRPAHPMILFNAALVARNRPEVMDRLIGGYDVWQRVGRWGSGYAKFPAAIPRAGRARVTSGFTEVGGTSKGHALVRFAFEVEEAGSGTRLAEGWMLLFLLGCAGEGGGKLATPRIAMPERPPDEILAHDTPVNVTFDWAMASGDWNTTHFETKGDNPAPLVHGPRNMGLVFHDAARLFAGGRLERLREITLGTMPAPHYPPERIESRFWREADGRLVGRLVVRAADRIDGGTDDKVVIDQIEIVVA